MKERVGMPVKEKVVSSIKEQGMELASKAYTYIHTQRNQNKPTNQNNPNQPVELRTKVAEDRREN